MNKYQESLYLIKESHAQGEFMYDNLDVGVLQELVEKATPKKGVDKEDNFGGKKLSCPKCNKPIVNVWSKSDYKPNYCHYCGQALDWGCM